MVFKFKFRSYKNYLDKNIEEKITIKKKMNIFCKKLSKNTISKNEKKNEKEMKIKQNKTKQIKIANVGRNLVPIVVQVQGDNR